jgi:phosphoribosylamine--glycine ligase
VTNGGRVLCVVGLDGNVKGAQTRAYEALSHITFDGAQFRTDIGYLAIKSK